MSEKLINFLRDNKAHINFSAIDREIEVTIGTVARVVRKDHHRYFTEAQEKKIIIYLSKLEKIIGKYMAQNLASSK